MNNTLVKAVEDYVKEVSRLAKSGITTEHTFRGALAILIDQLAPTLKAFNEPKRTQCGAPDYIVQDKTGLGIFYVEAKDIGDGDLDGKKRTGHKEQFDRYKAALDTIIFTDYLDFHLYRHGQFVASVKIADWDGTGKVTGIAGAYNDLVNLVAEAASSAPQKIDNSKRLAELMAGKARLLQRNSANFLSPITKAYDDAPVNAKPPVTPILELLIGMRDVLMPEVGAEEFSDIFAQTLTYGMFAARLYDPTPETFSRYEAMDLIPKTNPFLKIFFQYVATNLEDELQWMVDDLADFFRAADVEKIMRNYGRTGADPMIHFYEDFLREYDAGLRKDRGVWYTPIQVVKFIVGAADWALKNRFGLADGLADRSKVEIECEEVAPHGKRMARKVKKTVHRVQMLDPATGTGTFIAEAIRQIFAKFKGNEGIWPSYAERDLLPRLNGFELLMASYTMAHIKVDFALRETGVTPSGKERFRIFLTDSLSDWHKVLPGGLFASALAPEQQGADEVKRDTPVMVVMGNPPYSGISQNNGDWIVKLVADYKVEPGGKQKLQEHKNWLNDDYVKFIRLAEQYVEKNGSGIVAYITPHGFLDNPTFRGMRWHLMQTFNEIWTLNLHGNSKKKEVTPDGGKDECVFNIMQGVAITLFVKCKGSTGLTRLTGLKDETKNLVNPVKNNCRVYYADLWGKKKDKLAALDGATMDSIQWQELKPVEPLLLFVPKDTSGEEEYCRGFRIDDLMNVNSTGVFTLGDPFAVAYDEKTLVERIEVVNSKALTEDEITSMFSLGKNYASFIKKSIPLPAADSITNYTYRPFDNRWITYSPATIWRPRKSVMSHFSFGKNLAILIGRQGQVVGPDEWNLVYTTENIVDLNVFYRGGGCVFPLYLYEENMGKVEKRANLDKDIVAKIAAILNPVNPVNPVQATPSPEDIFAYIYGVLHSPNYRAKFKEFLKTDFPRIPYPKDEAQFKAISEIGRSLIDTHLMRDAAPGLSETRARFPKMGDNIVEKVVFEEGRVFINSEQYFDNVPQVSWELPIGGYRPAEKWLKDRKGRALSQNDILHYQRIIIALQKTRELMDKLSSCQI